MMLVIGSARMKPIAAAITPAPSAEYSAKEVTRWISWAGSPAPSLREARVEAPRPNRPAIAMMTPKTGTP